MNNKVPLDSKIFVAGHRGLVGSAIMRRLQAEGCKNLVLRTHKELDLIDQSAVRFFFEQERPEIVVLAAAKVGGIMANFTYPGEFIYENIMIQSNIIHWSQKTGVKRLLFLGSACIFPKLAPQPMKEEYLLTGPLEPTNDAYAVAKIAGIKMCESYRRQYGSDFRSVMPTNLYGPNDNFDFETSHVLPALLRKFHQAVLTKGDTVSVWGSGRPRREFLHVDDMVAASLHIMNLSQDSYWSVATPHCSHINVGSGSDVSILELSELIAGITGFNGRIEFDASMPDGTPRKLLDISRLKQLGWQKETGLEEGIRQTYAWMVEHWSQVVDAT